MGNFLAKKREITPFPIHVSTYSISFKYYITSLRTKTLTTNMINNAVNECNNPLVWASFFESIFKHIQPKNPSTNISVTLIKSNRVSFDGIIHWTFPTTPSYTLNQEMKIYCPTCVYTITGENWAGIAFIDMIKEFVEERPPKKIEDVEAT